MDFSLSKLNFAKYFASKTKYSIPITADDSITKKFPVLKDGPLEVALFWHTQFDELTQLKNFDAANKFTNIVLLRSGDGKDKWINACNDIMPNNENPTEAHFHAVWTTFIIKQLWSIQQNCKRTMRLSTKGQETSQYETL
jgi:hypothetical protein